MFHYIGRWCNVSGTTYLVHSFCNACITDSAESVLKYVNKNEQIQNNSASFIQSWIKIFDYKNTAFSMA